METSILKDAIKEISELNSKCSEVREIDGHSYLINNGKYEEVTPDMPSTPSCTSFTSLDGLVQHLKAEFDDIISAVNAGGKLYVHVESHDKVRVMTGLDEYNRRTQVYAAICGVKNWEGANWFGHESAMIALQSMFVANEGTEYLLDFLSRITDENSVSSDDNGMTQTVQVKKGVALAARETVRPIVGLRPYRTFLEVAQPESNFLIRVREGCEVGFIEADGGMWKFAARRAVKDYLEAELRELIESGRIVVSL